MTGSFTLQNRYATETHHSKSHLEFIIKEMLFNKHRYFFTHLQIWYNFANILQVTTDFMSLFLNPHRTVKFSFVIVILGFLVYGDNQVEAQVKVLSNSRHAYGDITNTIDQLLGAGHVGTDIIVDSTSMSGDTFSGGPAAAINPNATYYDHTGAMVSSSAHTVLTLLPTQGIQGTM